MRVTDDLVALRYQMSERDILDTAESGGELAVRLAIGEAGVIQENKAFFAAHGVDLAALESSSSTAKASVRSNTTMLVKNLPHDSNETELESMFGRCAERKHLKVVVLDNLY